MMLAADESIAFDFGFPATWPVDSWQGLVHILLPLLTASCVVLILVLVSLAADKLASSLRGKRLKGKRRTDSPIVALN